MTRAELDDRVEVFLAGPQPSLPPDQRVSRASLRSALADAVAVAYIHAARKAEQFGRLEESADVRWACREVAKKLYEMADGMAEFITTEDRK